MVRFPPQMSNEAKKRKLNELISKYDSDISDLQFKIDLYNKKKAKESAILTGLE